ncbi:uncharacterized protein TM35_001201030 [Trypanosoma theileri]|uniref:Uncharacterized protein n=1 Tax=Trypanosoma theileri TaxID=67003 RepID=A0A1X0NDS8_9TRYP|nr:uncharacterized protein TM35_001201030 [Trypanosoma theileri]ORC81341.1 hypothetical protein TM35_001201030 [Trypanosoma theileri]
MFFCGYFGYNHARPNAPYPVRFVKSSGHRAIQYGGECWRWNPGRRTLLNFFFATILGQVPWTPEVNHGATLAMAPNLRASIPQGSQTYLTHCWIRGGVPTNQKYP